MLVTISRTGRKRMLRNPIWLTELLDLAECNVLAVPGWLQSRQVEVVGNHKCSTALPRAS